MDAIIDPDGTVRVRVTRDGAGDGRVYEIAYSAADACGGTSLGRVSVCVPHRPGDACVDDGQRYNSLKGQATMAALGAEDGPPLTVRPAPGGSFAIRYSLADAAEMQLEVFDLSGRRVASLDSGRREAGAHEVAWTPSAPHGVYFVRLQRDGQPVVRRFVALP